MMQMINKIIFNEFQTVFSQSPQENMLNKIRNLETRMQTMSKEVIPPFCVGFVEKINMFSSICSKVKCLKLSQNQ